MPHSTTLDPADARPLTSREISKVLCSIIAGVVVYDPAARSSMPEVLAAVRTGTAPAGAVDDLAWRRTVPRQKYAGGGIPITPSFGQPASWATALSATVAGFRGWCAPNDIATALTWVTENLHEICPPN